MGLTWVRRTESIPDQDAAWRYLSEGNETHYEMRGLAFMRLDEYEAHAQQEDDWGWKCSAEEPGATAFWEAAFGPALEE